MIKKAIFITMCALLAGCASKAPMQNHADEVAKDAEYTHIRMLNKPLAQASELLEKALTSLEYRTYLTDSQLEDGTCAVEGTKLETAKGRTFVKGLGSVLLFGVVGTALSDQKIVSKNSCRVECKLTRLSDNETAVEFKVYENGELQDDKGTVNKLWKKVLEEERRLP